MIKLLDLVDAVFVINLPERVDRRSRMDKVLASIGLSFDQENVFLFPAVRVSDAAGFPSPGVRGCFLSHKTVLEQAREAGYKKVLILEDDVEFARNTLTLLETLPTLANAGDLPNDFFYFGFEDPLNKAKFVGAKTQKLQLEEIPGRVVCAHAYTVSCDIYDDLINHLDECLEGEPGDLERGPMDVDGAYNAFRRRYPHRKATVVQPQVAWQRVTHSDLHARTWHQAPGIRQILKPIRILRNRLILLSR